MSPLVTKKMIAAATKAHHQYWCGGLNGEKPDHKEAECSMEIWPDLVEDMLVAALAADGRRKAK